MKFNELKIGEIFQFKFDAGTRWSYEKISSNEVRCIQAPFTETASLNKISILPAAKWVERYSEVKILPGC